MDLICQMLATSNGKDKIIRLFCYSSYFVASWDWTSPNLKKSLLFLSSELSKARTISRLFDDLPMLNYSLQCWRSKDQNVFMTINNILDQLYYPVEHLVSNFQVTSRIPLKFLFVPFRCFFNLGCLKRRPRRLRRVFPWNPRANHWILGLLKVLVPPMLL